MIPRQAIAKLTQAREQAERWARNEIYAARAHANHGTYSTYERRAEQAYQKFTTLLDQVEAHLKEQIK
jgi:hypothetical protein